MYVCMYQLIQALATYAAKSFQLLGGFAPYPQPGALNVDPVGGTSRHPTFGGNPGIADIGGISCIFPPMSAIPEFPPKRRVSG